MLDETLQALLYQESDGLEPKIDRLLSFQQSIVAIILLELTLGLNLVLHRIGVAD